MAKTLSSETPDKFAGAINDEALIRHVGEIERLQGERKVINDRIGQSYKDARSAGFNARLLRRIISERRLDPDTRREQYDTLDSYRRALGMFADTPLGEAAMHRAETAANGRTRPGPAKKFAEQPVHPRRRPGRPRTNGADPLAAARAHLDGNRTPPL